jgi:GNAT superfamily N-acetyltransferase
VVSVTTPDRPAGTPGLRSLRASFTPRTLVATGPGHLVLQTAGRQDFHEGNGLHVDELVDVGSLDRWLQAFDERLAHLPGVGHITVRWETGADFAAAGAYATRMAAAVADHGLELDRMTVMELGDDVVPMVPLTAGIHAVRATSDPHWWGARALHISGYPETPAEFWTWMVDQQRSVVEAGAGVAWLAYRFGTPVGTAAILRDGRGLASIDGVITHAVHRRLGVASHLVAVACAAYRDGHPDERIVLLADHGSDAERLYARLGFRAVGTVWGAVGRALPAGRR